MLNVKIKNYLDKLDQETKPLSSFNGEHDFAKGIKEIITADNSYVPTKEDAAEQAAFDFMEDYRNEDSGWGTYHGPMFVLPNSEGQMVEYPSVKRVDQETLDYWAKRAKESKYPIFKFRYANLVVDFSPRVLSRDADIELIRMVIDSSIEICANDLADPLDCKTKIKRALALSVQINDQERTANVKEAVIKLERKVATDDKPGLWGFAFKWLILDFGKKISLDDQEKSTLIKEIEERLARVKDNPWLTENAVSLLAEYFASEKDETNLMRVLAVLEKAHKSDKRAESDALLKLHSYEQTHEIYRKYASRFPSAEQANKRLSREIGNLDLDWEKSLKTISVETKIPQEQIDNFLVFIFGKTEEEHEIGRVMARLTLGNLPKKDDITKQLKDVSSKYPMQFLCTTQVIADDGIPIAKLGTLEEDYDNHFQKYALQYVQFGSFFLSLSLDELKKRFPKEDVIDHFQKATLFENEDRDYLTRAIFAYWEGDFLIASHLFNPLIESGIRELVKNCGGLILKPNNMDGYDRVLLGALLKNNEIFENVFSQSGHNILFYFRLVLTEKLGMNLRNDFAHGFGKKKFFGRDASDRLFHVLVWLSLVTKRPPRQS
jgi:hypothetical protein